MLYKDLKIGQKLYLVDSSCLDITTAEIMDVSNGTYTYHDHSRGFDVYCTPYEGRFHGEYNVGLYANMEDAKSKAHNILEIRLNNK